MMGYRDDALRVRLMNYLDRRAMPAHLKDKKQAQIDEVDALLRAISRLAPRDDVESWWPKVADSLDANRKFSTWPSVGEVVAACKDVGGPGLRRIAQGDEIDPLQVIATKMQAGEAVGDGCFYGRIAVDLVARGMVTQAQMKSYRSALWFRLKDVYKDEAIARRIEDSLKARHAAAESAGPTPIKSKEIPEVKFNRLPRPAAE